MKWRFRLNSAASSQVSSGDDGWKALESPEWYSGRGLGSSSCCKSNKLFPTRDVGPQVVFELLRLLQAVFRVGNVMYMKRSCVIENPNKSCSRGSDSRGAEGALAPLAPPPSAALLSTYGNQSISSNTESTR